MSLPVAEIHAEEPIPALMVGSRAAWLAKLRPKLDSVKIDVRWHWENKGDAARAIPPGCAIVLISTDSNSHALSTPAVVLARAAGVPVIFLSHRWSQSASILAQHGFRTPPAPGMATIAASPTLSAAIEAPRSTLPVPKETEPMPAPAPEPEPSYGARYDALSNNKRDTFLIVLRYLAVDPWLTTTDAVRLTGLPDGKLWQVLAAARETLTIDASTGSGAGRIRDRAVYEAWCRKLDVTPCAQNVGPVRAPHTAGNAGVRKHAAQQAAVPQPQPPVPQESAPLFGGAPILITIPPMPPPPATLPVPVMQAATPAPELPADVRDAVSILRAAMRDYDFRTITVNADGTVAWERAVITRGTYTL